MVVRDVYTAISIPSPQPGRYPGSLIFGPRARDVVAARRRSLCVCAKATPWMGFTHSASTWLLAPSMHLATVGMPSAVAAVLSAVPADTGQRGPALIAFTACAEVRWCRVRQRVPMARPALMVWLMQSPMLCHAMHHVGYWWPAHVEQAG